MVMEAKKQRTIAKPSNVNRYVTQFKQLEDNRLFSSIQGIFFMGGGWRSHQTRRSNNVLDRNLGNISHNERAYWIGRVEEKLKCMQQ